MSLHTASTGCAQSINQSYSPDLVPFMAVSYPDAKAQMANQSLVTHNHMTSHKCQWQSPSACNTAEFDPRQC